jgi:hypothetical protein
LEPPETTRTETNRSPEGRGRSRYLWLLLAVVTLFYLYPAFEVLPDPDLEMVELGIQGGYLACGDPDEVIEQLKRYEATGIDQICFSLPIDMPQEVCLETIRLLGEHVIPKFDQPEFRTDRMRAAADVPSWGSQAIPQTLGPDPEPGTA